MIEVKYKPCPFCGFAPKIVELKDNIKSRLYCKVEREGEQ